MKKLLLLLGLTGLAGVGVFLFRHPRPEAVHRIQPAHLLPSDTVAFFEFTDLPRSVERFRKTSLQALAEEPEVQAFLEQPRQQAPLFLEAAGWGQKILQARPRQGFLAVTALENRQPHWLAGLALGGSPEAAEALLAPVRERLLAGHPAAQASLVSYREAPIRLRTDGSFTLAETSRQGWYWLADSLPALQALLDRLEGTTSHDHDTLAADENYRESTHRLPDDAELRGFVRLAPVREQFAPVLPPSAAALFPAASWENARGLGLASRMEGADWQDTVFLWSPGQTPGVRLPLTSLALTTPETVALASARREVSPRELEGLLSFASGPLPGDSAPRLPETLPRLGPELTLALELPSALTPEWLLHVPLGPGAAAWMPALESFFHRPGVARREEGSRTTYTLPAASSVLSGPKSSLVALTSHDLVFSPWSPAAWAGIARLESPHPTLEQAPRFLAATEAIPAATEFLAFVQTEVLFTRIYGIARPVLAAGLAFNPATAGLVDASRLPSAAALGRHLGPMAASVSLSTEGSLLVSRGPVSLLQVSLALGGAALSAPASGWLPADLPFEIPALLPRPAPAGKAPLRR